MKYKILLPALVLAIAATSCSGLSKEAKEMVGEYYIDEVSIDSPVLVLKSNGTVVQRAIKPGVLSYSVKGKWNVEHDSLIIKNDTVPFDIEGDSTLIGEIPQRMSKAVVAFNGITLTLRSGGADYVYFRRGSQNKK